MYEVSYEEFRQRKPLIIDSLARKAWGSSDKGLLSQHVLTEAIGQVGIFVSNLSTKLSELELAALLTDYLRIHGYDVSDVSRDAQPYVVTTSFITPDGLSSQGCAIALTRWSEDLVAGLRRDHPDAAYYHVLVLEDDPPLLQDRVKLVTAHEVRQLLTYIVVIDYFFEDYLNSVLAMPGFRQFMYQYLEEECGLNTELRSALERGWEILKN